MHSFELRREGAEMGWSKDRSPERTLGEIFGWGLGNRVDAQREARVGVELPS